MTRWNQPLVRRNEWTSLEVPDLGTWTPDKTVTVVIPVWADAAKLPYVLAGLAAQSYPAHLLEVIVADDGNAPPLELPDVRPERTRLVRPTSGWGKSNACNAAVAVAEGEIIHWLDADMLVYAEHVEAQLRWHHVIDYAVVLGTKRFVDPSSLLGSDPARVRDIVAAGAADDLFAGQETAPHKWVEGMWRRTDQLTQAGHRGFRSHVGATGSVRRDVFVEVGQLNTTLVTGEDVELGYRLAEAGSVLIPDEQARSWHLGASQVMEKRDQVNRYNDASLTNLVPGMRPKRNRRGRIYDVPYVEAVVPMAADADEVIRAVDALLDSDLGDLEVLLVGPWSDFTDERHTPLLDPMLDLRITERTYRNDPRVTLVEEVPQRRCRATYRLVLESTRWAPTPPALLAMLEDLERTHEAGRSLVTGADGVVVATLRSTAATSRAARVGAEGLDQVDEVIASAFGSQRLSVEEAGWVPTLEREVPRHEGKLKPPVDPATSRAMFDAALGVLGTGSGAGPGTGTGTGAGTDGGARADSATGASNGHGAEAERRGLFGRRR